ncbi:MAG: 30S ribosomal protein S1 [Candidatus Aminicenantes bacterium]|nr:30S ribosomal protein S1 [Candidatus Aminicenantes bacterium]
MSEITKNQEKEEEQLSSEDYASLLDQYQFTATEIAPGKLVKGKVIKTMPSHLLVDVGFKSEGIIHAEEFSDLDEFKAIKEGDTVEAMLVKRAREGYLVLSKRKADAVKALNTLEKSYHQKTWILGKIIEKIKNGYIVNVGIKAFLPDSHADIRIVKDPNELLGNSYKFKVIKFDRKSENAVLSRKLLLQDEKEKRKRKIFETIAKGQKAEGKIKTLTNFGAFVDIGGIEGLLHISDISWGKINHPSEMFQIGQDIEVIILDFNEKEEKISLGYKQLTPDPWENLDKKYTIGQKIKGTVVSLADFGAFVELEKGVEGLVHISDLSWSRKPIHPKKLLSPGQEVEVSILDINLESKRISLGLKQVTPHPLEVFNRKYSVGSIVKGTITNITDFGAFMEVEKGIEGLIHISDISWEKIKHPSEKLKAGEEIEAIILNINIDNQKLSLGIKQLEGDIWEDFFNRQKIGDIVKTKINRITDFGVFVEITPGIEGVVFLSELDEKKIDDPSESFKVKDEHFAKIIKMSQKDKKISLSFKQAQIEMQKMEYKKFMDKQDDKMTLGDIMKDKLKDIQLPKKKDKKDKKDKKEEKND